jgi:hypothetical protein
MHATLIQYRPCCSELCSLFFKAVVCETMTANMFQLLKLRNGKDQDGLGLYYCSLGRLEASLCTL